MKTIEAQIPEPVLKQAQELAAREQIYRDDQNRSHSTDIPKLPERFNKYCSHSATRRESGLFGFWLRFDSVTGRCGHAPSSKPRQNPKSLAPIGHTIS
jgi:hypothetical protein